MAQAATDPRAREAGRALDVRESDGAITIHQHRTGEQETYSVSVSGLPNDNGVSSNGGAVWSPALIAARLAAPPLDVSLSEMTERQRTVVEDGVRQRLVSAAFGNEATIMRPRDAAEGLSKAVVDTVTELARTPSDHLTTRLLALLDLLALDGMHIPFDAQTRFYDAFLADRTNPPSAEISALAWRLGFASGEMANA